MYRSLLSLPFSPHLSIDVAETWGPSLPSGPHSSFCISSWSQRSTSRSRRLPAFPLKGRVKSLWQRMNRPQAKILIWLITEEACHPLAETHRPLPLLSVSAQQIFFFPVGSLLPPQEASLKSSLLCCCYCKATTDLQNPSNLPRVSIKTGVCRCSQVEIQPIVIRALTGLRGASVEQSPIKAAGYILRRDHWERTGQLMLSVLRSHNCQRGCLPNHPTAKGPSTFQKAPQVFLFPPFFPLGVGVAAGKSKGPCASVYLHWK